MAVRVLASGWSQEYLNDPALHWCQWRYVALLVQWRYVALSSWLFCFCMHNLPTAHVMPKDCIRLK